MSILAKKDGLRPRLVLAVVGFGTFLSAMAASSINLALPTIGADLNIPIGLSEWVMLSFLLTVTILMLVAGRVADMIGHRPVYLAGFVLFGAASALCGLAGTIGLLVSARIIQGIGGAMIMATAPALLTTTCPSHERGKALGILATATYSGLTIGPSLGGFLIATGGWRWIFYLNIPIAAIIVLAGLIFLPPTPRPPSSAFDAKGAFSLLAGLPFLLIATSEGTRWGWLSWQTIGMAAFGLAMLGLFIRTELRVEKPLLNLGLFRSAVFTGAALSALCNYISLFVPAILLPFYLIEAINLNNYEAGLLLSMQPLVMALVASPSGWLSDRMGSRGLSVMGLLILSGGLAGLSTIGAHTQQVMVALWLALIGLGTGIFISPNSSALMGAAPKNQQGVAGGVMAVARNFGMLIGVAVATAIFQTAGGQTGHSWQPVDLQAFQISLWVAVVFGILGALAAAIKEKS